MSFSTTVVIFLITVCSIFEFNDYRLPFNIYFELLPNAGHSINWILNYLYHCYVIFCLASFFYIYFAMTMIIINHCCWGADVSILLVQELSKVLDNEDDRDTAKMRNELIAKKLKNIIEMTYDRIDYHDHVQSLMQLNFLVDFTLFSFLLGMCFFSIQTSVYSAILLLSVLTQLFIYCWIGNRVIDCYEALAASLYDLKWYMMCTRHQKDLQLILLRVQAMRGFNGVFKTVNLETFQNVCFKTIFI